MLGNNLFVHLYCYADIQDDVMPPMGRMSIRGFAFPALAEPNAQLHVNYRKDWRIPCRPGGLTTKGSGALF